MAETAANATEGLAPEERLRFDAMLVEQRFADRQILLEEGQPAPGLLLLRAGTVLVNKRDMGGNEQLIIELRAPAVLGELELLTGDLCNTTVVAKGGAVASLLPAATFGRLLDERDAVAVRILRNLARVLGRKLSSSNEVYADLAIWGR